MMKSFRNPVTNVLNAFGYVDSNAPGDIAQNEAEDFNLTPGKWQLVAGEWVTLPPTAPTPIQQIRALEQAHDDDQRKLNRQGAIDTALTVACRNPAAASMTRDQVHAAYYAGNRGYKAMVDLEAQCAALRKLIV